MARELGQECRAVPVSDGGEGFLDCFGPPNRSAVVTGPFSRPVEASWTLLDDGLAVVEMAQASRRAHARVDDDPLASTTRGTGELIALAIRAGAHTVLVCAGGSATTDSGAGAVRELESLGPLDGSRGYEVTVAVDVTTPFVDAVRRRRSSTPSGGSARRKARTRPR